MIVNEAGNREKTAAIYLLTIANYSIASKTNALFFVSRHCQ